MRHLEKIRKGKNIRIERIVAMKNELEKKVKISDIILSNNIYISLIIFAVAFIICAVCVPNILLPSNIISVLRMNSISGIVAIGMTLVMLTG